MRAWFRKPLSRAFIKNTTFENKKEVIQIFSSVVKNIRLGTREKNYAVLIKFFIEFGGRKEKARVERYIPWVCRSKMGFTG